MPRVFLSLSFLVVCAFHLTVIPAVAGSEFAAAAAASGISDQTPPSPPSDSTVSIPGPLRSFLRMAGISQKVSPQDVLPALARSMSLHGYQTGRPTEYLVLLRRYFHQAKELSDLAPKGSIEVAGCKEAEPFLRILGYRIQGECGKPNMALVTADAERAFLTIDSGFPLLDLEDALRQSRPFSYPYSGSPVPILFAPSDWASISNGKFQKDKGKDLVESILYEPELARLYWAMSRIDPETSAVLKKDAGLAKLLPLAPVIDLYGSQLCIRAGAVVVPGGHDAEKQWHDLVGANPKVSSEFALQLFKKDHGWLAAYYDSMARASQSQQEHFVAGQRLKRFYAAFRSPGVSSDAAASAAFRPAPALMVLVSRMHWDAAGNPYVPGSFSVWSEILRQRTNYRLVRQWAKHADSWRSPDQLAEAMFVFSRLETDTGPVQMYLCFSELDHRRLPDHRLSDGAVDLLAAHFSDFSGQYLLFSEFPELDDVSITRFLTAADAVTKISDHAVRGNAMGVFQANVGLWQILARQGQIEPSRFNSSLQDVLAPFARFNSSAQLFTAARNSVQHLGRAATEKPSISQDELINLLAGARQTSPEGQRMHTEMANRIRAVLDDQRLVSIDTLFALDDGLRASGPGTVPKETLLALAGELREFEMPQPIFTSGERTRWAAGTYNNRHTEQQMRTDLAKTINSQAATPAQKEAARGQLATFLRDTLVGLNYAYYEPPGSQVLHNNPLFVRSHDFSGDTVQGVQQLWQSAQVFGAGSPAGGGAHLIGSLADLPYVLAEAEQDFISPEHVQALIWQQFVPGLLSNAIVPRWWNVSRTELHAVTLYQRAGEELLAASAHDDDVHAKVSAILGDRMFPQRSAWLDRAIRDGNTNLMLEGIMPADAFYLVVEFRRRFPGQLSALSSAGRELEDLSRDHPDETADDRLSRDFGIPHPVFAHSYAREFLNVRPFPALGGTYSRLMGECWESGNLYWARLADEMGYSPVLLNRIVPELTRRMVEKIFASDLEDWPAILRALQETGAEFREGKISLLAGITNNPLPGNR